MTITNKLNKIESITMKVVDQIGKGESPVLKYNSRTTWKNIGYVIIILYQT